MPNFTKIAIKESFVKLLNEKPLNQITVRDIASDCRINRNTFYYHFEDIPSLLKEIIMEEANYLIEKYPTVDSLEDSLAVAIKYLINKKNAVLHIYNSVNRDIYEHYFWNVCEHFVTVYIESMKEKNIILEEDRNLFIKFFKCELFGAVLNWMDTGMNENVLEYLHRMCEISSMVIEKLKDNSR